jgi:fatty acid desaturase
MTGGFEAALREKVEADLPPRAFERRPWRILLALPMVGGIAAASVLLAWPPLPWYAALGGSIILGNAYVALMFFGHEAAHGAIVRSRRLQELLLFFTLAIYLVSPHLWRHWHNYMHHANTNIPGIDPDHFASVRDVEGRADLFTWLTVRLAPGSGHWLSAVYLLASFTIQGQLVLWSHIRRAPPRGYDGRRAVGETLLIAAFWLAASVALGARGAVFAVVLPMLVANAVIMSYVVTNHMLRPLATRPDDFTTTMSVTTLRIVDFVHLHFSHHTEHHLYPALSHRYYPLVRASLRRHAADRYLAPAHWRALAVLYTTPRYYAEPADGVTDLHLVNPLTGHRTSMAAVEARLRAESSGLRLERTAMGEDPT